MLLLPLQVGVEQGLVAFPAPPEDVVLAAEFLGDLEGLLHLGRRVGEDVGVGIRGCPAHVPGVREEVGRAPEEPDPGRLLEGLGVGDNPVEVAVGLGERCPLGGDVTVVKAPEGRLDLDEEFKRGVHPLLGHPDGIPARLPGAPYCPGAEGIAADAPEGVPVGDREAKVILERAAIDHLGGVIVLEGERVP